MFKFIGAIVVMGFAGYGLSVFVKDHVVADKNRGADPE